jgi:multiple sugar transport system substrate-binding protein
MAVLRGVTWDHQRGVGGLEATAQVYNRSHDTVQLEWERRPLSDFREHTLDDLAAAYDLLVIEHPFVGSVAKSACLLPLESLMPHEFLELQHEQSVGASYRSYEYAGHQWALSLDASAQVSAYRPDLLATPPKDWDSLTELALRNGPMIGMPLVPAESFTSFLTICANAGEPPFVREGEIVSRESALHSLTILQRLAGLVNKVSFTLDTPGLLEVMSSGSEIAYSPLVFGYCNYSRHGFRDHLVRFGDIPSSGEGPNGSVLGGAGISISAKCADPRAAAEYVMWICLPEVQRGLYFESGGQPGNRVAWLDEVVNSKADDFFKRTIATLSGAYLRPRYDGYVDLQTACGRIVHDGLLSGRNPEKVNAELNECYVSSKRSSG